MKISGTEFRGTTIAQFASIAVLIMLWLWWMWIVPDRELRWIPLFVIGPIIFLLWCRLDDKHAAHRIETPRNRLREGLCVYCAYDLRHGGKRCPECGKLQPDGSLPLCEGFEEKSGLTIWQWKDLQLIDRAKRPTYQWFDDLSARIAELLAQRFVFLLDWSNGNFIPSDPAVAVHECDDMLLVDLHHSLKERLGLDLESKVMLDVFLESPTFGEMVDKLRVLILTRQMFAAVTGSTA